MPSCKLVMQMPPAIWSICRTKRAAAASTSTTQPHSSLVTFAGTSCRVWLGITLPATQTALPGTSDFAEGSAISVNGLGGASVSALPLPSVKKPSLQLDVCSICQALLAIESRDAACRALYGHLVCELAVGLVRWALRWSHKPDSPSSPTHPSK